MYSTSGMGVRWERGRREKEIGLPSFIANRYPVASPPPRRGLWSSSRGRGGEVGRWGGWRGSLVFGAYVVASERVQLFMSWYSCWQRAESKLRGCSRGETALRAQAECLLNI